METERITPSQRERNRIRVLHEVKQGHLTQRKADWRLRLSDRQVRRRLSRIGEYGGRAVIHGWRGLPEPLSAPAPRPESGAARGKSFRPTASSLTAKQQSSVYKSAPPNHPWRTVLLCVDSARRTGEAMEACRVCFQIPQVGKGRLRVHDEDEWILLTTGSRGANLSCWPRRNAFGAFGHNPL